MSKLNVFYESLNLKGTDLAHWGVKGMKWGIRRSDDELARLSGGQTEADDAARARQTLTQIKKAKSLAVASDSDLNHLVSRLNLEKRYVDIKTSTSVVTKTDSKINSLLKVGDTMNRAYSFANSGAGQLLGEKLGLIKVNPTGKHTAAAVAAAQLAKKK